MGIIASVLGLLGCSGGGATSGSRYTLVRDEGSRYGFKFVFDKKTKKWPYRESEFRVSLDREIPDPLWEPEHGPRLSVQLMTSGTAQSGGMDTYKFEVRDGYRVWQVRDHLHRDDLKGLVSYGVQVSWPKEGESTRHEVFEVFKMPPLGDMEPGTWTEWTGPSNLRAGGMGWWEEVQGEPNTKVQPVKFPFQMRQRLILKDVPGVLP